MHNLTKTCAVASNIMQKINGFLPDDNGLQKALTGADVVIIPAGVPRIRVTAPLSLTKTDF